MITFPNCKINLGLWVTRKRPDDYHDIETVIFPIDWTDVLEIIPSSGTETEFTLTGNVIGGNPESNLCYKAWKLLHEKHAIPVVKMHLHKVIPIGAGLGGGSSDGSFALKMLNQLFDLHLTTTELQHFAAQLGMDCPFFIENVPSIASGRGDVLKPVNLNLKGYYLIVLVPDIHLSTSKAYSVVTPQERSETLENQLNQPLSTWKTLLVNDFEESVFKQFPKIKELKEMLYSKGALFVSMSGSGSAVFGIFERNPGMNEPKGCYMFQTLLGSDY